MTVHELLDEMSKLYVACTSVEHGIRDQAQPWKFYRPSQFVYSFFAFNSIYSFDWQSTLDSNTPIDWDAIADESGTTSGEKPRESKKFQSLTKFCFEKLGARAATYYRSRLQHHLYEVRDPIRELQGIVPDGRTARFIPGFQAAFSNVIDGSPLSPGNARKALNDLLFFVYSVRNNIFHGTKTITGMMDRSQQNRLAIYTAITLATIELFLEAATEAFNWRMPHAVRQAIEGRRPRWIPPESLPPGKLFYPCCGSDLGLPLQLFAGHLSELIFVDPEAKLHLRKLRDHGIRLQRSSKELSVRTEYRIAGTTDNNAKIVLIRDDALSHLSRMDEIAVFYYCGDTEAEGGSGIPWLGAELFEQVLSILVDGGLIVTDGSNTYAGHPPRPVYPCDPAFESLPWRSLAQNIDTQGGSTIQPPNFTFAGREFTCLGQVGRGRGPIFAWQVNRINKSITPPEQLVFGQTTT